jgi:hypothetical protein
MLTTRSIMDRVVYQLKDLLETITVASLTNYQIVNRLMGLKCNLCSLLHRDSSLDSQTSSSTRIPRWWEFLVTIMVLGCLQVLEHMCLSRQISLWVHPSTHRESTYKIMIRDITKWTTLNSIGLAPSFWIIDHRSVIQWHTKVLMWDRSPRRTSTDLTEL